jgi:tripartite-type tricarboxylate transporter receptor subunit TctC
LAVETAPVAFAEGRFPDHPLKIIVPVSPGSGADTVTRFVAEKLAVVLGQPVIVDNRPSANGAVSVVTVKSAPADGYTLLLSTISTLSVNPAITQDLPYDPVKDLRPVSGMIRVTSVLVVPPDSKFKTLADLIAAARKDPAAVRFGSYSNSNRLLVEWMGSLAGVKLNNVAYKGPSQMLPDVVAGRTELGIIDLAGAEQLMKAGRLRGLAVLSEKRSPDFLDVPTVSETYPECVAYPWTALHVRAETPDDVTAKLADAMQKVLAMPETKAYAAKTPGTELLPLGPAAMRQYHLAEYARFRQIAAKAGIKAD